MYYYDKNWGHNVEDMINEYIEYKKTRESTYNKIHSEEGFIKIYNNTENNQLPLQSKYEENDILESELDFVKHLHGEVLRKIYPFVEQTVDEMDYEGSHIYDEQIPMEMLGLLTEKAYNRVINALPELADMSSMTSTQHVSKYWGREELGRGLIQSLVYHNIYGIKRPHHRRRKHHHGKHENYHRRKEHYRHH